MSSPVRIAAFVTVCGVSIAMAGIYTWRGTARRAALTSTESLPSTPSIAAFRREAPSQRGSDAALPTAPPAQTEEKVPSALRRGPDDVPRASRAPAAAETSDATIAAGTVVLFRHTGLDASFGRLSVQRPRGAAETRRETSLRCDRVYFAGDRGVCLTTDRAYTTQSILVFGKEFQTLHTLALGGLPSRVRLSRNGRLAAVTVFDAGHSYADGAFSTRTSIIDTYSGSRMIDSLEECELWMANERVTAADVNYWGVSFADDNDTFYASVGTGGRIHLVEGRVSSRRMVVVRENVECPSLAPDQTRLAFKKRMPAPFGFAWRLHVLSLGTLREIALAESRNVDDQVEWLDDSALLYALPSETVATPKVTDVWKVPADGTGKPELFLQNASSPVVLTR